MFLPILTVDYASYLACTKAVFFSQCWIAYSSLGVSLTYFSYLLLSDFRELWHAERISREDI